MNTRIGYILKVYPRFSETFIVTEILAREAIGDELTIFALRPTTDARFHPELARVRAEVKWIGRPFGAEDLWQRITGIVEESEIVKNFAAILPELSTLGHTEVAQGLELALKAKHEGITHFHAHFAALSGRMAWVASKLTGIPYTVTTHAKDIFHNSVDMQWLRRICGDATRVIAISQYNYNYLQQVLSGTGANISLQYNALELERFPYHKPPTLSEPLEIAAVGRLVPKKGFGALIEAVAIVKAKGIPVKVSLGGAGELKEELEQKISDLDLDDTVTMLGPLNQEEVRELLRRSHVFVAPCVPGADGNVDGLPTVILEAMACGTPVIATSVTGIPEVIRHDDTGILLEPGHVPALAQALENFARGTIDGLSLSRNARKFVEKHFDSLSQARTLSGWESAQGV
ncbi:glycosyltransferase family 4 protein [Corynebacterium felinum]|uniref:Glycosyltransferase involved in cell wall biosynthesis n=1 Tax=Corynebacterium felinum TaxID=131318 RepID=A0ABU2BCA9_9CORY|nr:glycosyltransferase family 4 protein [Corynebacterium felinum]MDF5820667.1 glycosyltransferase family 4 protein [Corynebacterium felinum]MDR7356270.1 glycosyltransferase involved in cell wall biosynthesis [Corynebacterium felinum]WJY95602.1 Putative teichuronic acid biosynthesis glycosyltransferase TuaC [Corynebacterium felinum]